MMNKPATSSDSSRFGVTAARSIGWIALDKWATRFFGLAILVILGRLLTPDDFGLVALTGVITAFATIFADAGFSKSLIQRDELTENDRSTAFWCTAFISSCLTLLLILLAGPIATVLGDDRLVSIIQWLSLSILLNGLSSVPAGLLERDFGFKPLAIRRVVGTIAGGVVAVAAALAGMGVWSLVVQTLVTAAVSLIILWASSPWKPKFTFSPDSFKRLWAVGSSVMGIELVGVIGSQADRLLIGSFLGAEALGFYFLAMRIVSILVELFSSVFSAVSLTAFSKIKNDRSLLFSWFYRFVGLSSAVTVPIFAIAAATSPVLIPMIFGQEWTGSVLPFQILTCLGALNSVAYFDRSVLIATGNSRAALLLTVGQAVLGIALICIALPWGMVSVALAVAARQYLFWPVRLAILKRRLGVGPWTYFSTWLRPVALTAGALILIACLYQVVPALRNYEYLYVSVAAMTISAFAIGGGYFLMPSVFVDLKKAALRRKIKDSA